MQRIKYKGKYFTGVENAVHVSDEYVQKMIDEVVDDMLHSKEEADFTFQSTGDTIVIGMKFSDGDITIIVTQDYDEACLYKDDYNRYQAVDWCEEQADEYENMSKSELIDRIMYLESIRPVYNPRREI